MIALTQYMHQLAIIGSDNGLAPTWTNAGILLIGTLGTNFRENWGEIQTFSFEKMYLNMSSGKYLQFYLGLNCVNASEAFTNDFGKWIIWIH